ncbi:hypothetical protein G3T14_22600 [Methylobacterium sp. BTF04]|nr:hypothetical protein [Methylobacterium sp. BTF04]
MLDEQKNIIDIDRSADTACGRVFALLQHIHDDSSHAAYEPELTRRAVDLINAAQSYAIYFAKIDECVMNLDYNSALKVGQALLQHEAMLHEIATGGLITHSSTLN